MLSFIYKSKETSCEMNKKVTYLPHIKKRLENKYAQMIRLISAGNVEEGLSHIENLLKHNYKTDELYVKKLYCLSELERWQEVEQLTEALPSEKSTPHKDLYYLISLFKQEQYELVIDYFHESIDATTIPEHIYKEIEYLYDESKHVINDRLKSITEELQLAILSQNQREQWLLFHQWEKLQVEPPELFFYMLKDERVNPFVKTNILQSLKEWQVAQEITVLKAGKSRRIIVDKLFDITSHPIYIETLNRTDSIEQNNPTLYALLLELLQRYVQYIYPFVYKSEDIKFVSEALVALAHNYLEGTPINEQKLSQKTNHFLEQIRHSNEVYFQLILT